MLRRWPLPEHDSDADKDARGRVLAVGGASQMPGAIILAATAALRAGAGKLQIATNRASALAVATSVPEAKVFALAENKEGAIAASAADAIVECAERVGSLLIGPGMVDEKIVGRLMCSVIPRVGESTLILDAAALAFLRERPEMLRALRGRVILTPHRGEMAGMLGVDKREIEKDPAGFARRAAARFKAVIALKGSETFICDARGEIYCNRTGNVGLATSGSGDTLSGIIAGLVARGAEPMHAACWGVHLHGRAGDKLARSMGPIGFLARELLAEIPPIMAEITARPKS